MHPKVLVIGAALVDLLTKVSSLPTSGSDVSASYPQTTVGGCALNVYSALQHQQIASDLLVPLGQGPFAQIIQQQFAQWHIKPLLASGSQDNGWDLCFVEPNGERSFLTFAGIEQHWQTAWFQACDWSNYQYLYLSGYELEEPSCAQLILQQLKRHAPHVPILFDTSPRINAIHATILEQLWQLPVIVHANQVELQALVPQTTDLHQQLATIFAVTKQPVIVTLGASGCVIYDGQTYQSIPAPQIQAIKNTSGAGDAHCGGLLAGLMQHKSWSDTLKQANQVAGTIVQKWESNFY